MKQLDKNFIWKLFYAGALVWAFILLILFSTIGISIVESQNKKYLDLLSHPFILYVLLSYLFLLAVAWVIAKYTHHFYKYEVRKKVIYIEKGIIWKKYINIPYNRIQNIDISRGLFDRILGLSTRIFKPPEIPTPIQPFPKEKSPASL